jgi:hypothetical protein
MRGISDSMQSKPHTSSQLRIVRGDFVARKIDESGFLFAVFQSPSFVGHKRCHTKCFHHFAIMLNVEPQPLVCERFEDGEEAAPALLPTFH